MNLELYSIQSNKKRDGGLVLTDNKVAIRKNKLNNIIGFTLIELIVVMAVLAIISGIALPRFLGIIDSAKISADQVTVGTLNKSTQLFRITNSQDDPFENIEINKGKSDDERLEKLENSGYLSSVVEPQTKDAKFAWIFDEEKWYLMFEDSFYEIKLLDGLVISNNGKLENQKFYNGESNDIFIPILIDGKEIKQIGQDVFSSIYTHKKLIAVKFDKNSKIVQIHARAFEGNELTIIDLPDSVKLIDSGAFKNNKLTEIKLPHSLTVLQDHVFENNKLTEIILPNSLTNIGARAFEKNPDLNKITIGSGVTIGEGAFDKNYKKIITEKFIIAYNITGGGAGTYIWNNVDWVKQ